MKKLIETLKQESEDLTKRNIQIKEEVGYAIFDTIYFKDKETCIKAINQVIIPFLRDNPKYRFTLI